MSLTNEQKQQYVNAIDAIWQGSMQNNNVSAISDEVAEKMDIILHQISNCSKPFLIMDLTYSWFYDMPTTLGTLLVAAALNGASVKGWIQALRGQTKYKACVNVTAINYKSTVQMALYGI